MAVVGLSLERFLAREDLPERAELVLGEVVEPMPESQRRYPATRNVERVIRRAFPGHDVAREVPLPIPDDGQPRPDVVVFREAQEAYLNRDVDARDVLAVVEVALATSDADYGTKCQQYAKGMIPEYVIVDLEMGVVVVRSEPNGWDYLRSRPLAPDETWRGLRPADLLGE